MALTTYPELATAIATWTHRDDLSGLVPDFVLLVENRLNRELRLTQQETKVTLSVVSGYATLPSDFLAVRTIFLATSPVQELTYIPPNDMDRLASNDTTMRYYTITENKVRFNGTPTAAISMVYYAKIPELNDAQTINWMSLEHPDIYLYGCLAEAFSYTQADEQAHKYMQLFMDSIQTLKHADASRKLGQSLQVRVA